MYKIIGAFTFIFCLQIIGLGQNAIVTTSTELIPRPTYFGGGIVLGGGSGSFQLGLNPELVKSYNDYVDLGAAVNLYYASYRNIAQDNMISYKSSNTQFGLGAFARIWPIEQFFIQVQPEYNWTFSSAKNLSQGTSGTSSVSAPSVLAGVGYGHRGENGFSYCSIMFDLVNSQQSPYRMGQISNQPIFRAGFGIPIHFPKTKRP
jgi:hypothetical protein